MVPLLRNLDSPAVQRPSDCGRMAQRLRLPGVSTSHAFQCTHTLPSNHPNCRPSNPHYTTPPTKRVPIPPPNPRPRQPKAEPLTFLQLNCNGIWNKTTELSRFLRTRKIKVAALQETKLTAKGKDPVFEDYTVVRKDRGSGAGGGLMFLVHQTIPFTPVDENTPPGEPLEHQSIQIPLLNEVLTIRNVYIPPSSSCPSNFTPSLTPSSRLDAP